MRILINMNILIQQKLSTDQYLLLLTVKSPGLMAPYITEYQAYQPFYEEDIKSLIERGWLVKNGEEFSLENLHLTEKFRIFVSSVSDWIDEWYDLWPKGMKSGGYYVRTDKQGCQKKLEKFVQRHSYNKDEIIEATKRYITRCLNTGSMIKLAPNFIEKDGISVLVGECEALSLDSTKVSTSLKEI